MLEEKENKRLERSGRREKEKAAATEKRKERKEGASQRGLRGGHPRDCRRRETRQESGKAGGA